MCRSFRYAPRKAQTTGLCGRSSTNQQGDTGSTAALCNSEREDRVSKLSAYDAMNSLQLEIFAKFNFINKSDSFYCEPHKQACCISKKHRF